MSVRAKIVRSGKYLPANIRVYLLASLFSELISRHFRHHASRAAVRDVCAACATRIRPDAIVPLSVNRRLRRLIFPRCSGDRSLETRRKSDKNRKSGCVAEPRDYEIRAAYTPRLRHVLDIYDQASMHERCIRSCR